MDEDPDGDCEGHYGDGVAGEVDGGRVLADADAVVVGRRHSEFFQRDARPVVAVVGPSSVRLANSSRVICKQ